MRPSYHEEPEPHGEALENEMPYGEIETEEHGDPRHAHEGIMEIESPAPGDPLYMTDDWPS